MRHHRTSQPQRFLRSLLRPSPILRAFWLAMALLHGWLIVRRFQTGDWAGGMDVVRAVLCLLAVAYATLKFWRISTIFDDRPRRAVAFILLLALGHWFVKAPAVDAAAPVSAELSAVLAVMPALGGLALALALTVCGDRRRRTRSATSGDLGQAGTPFDPDARLGLLSQFLRQIHRRPPPLPA